jgi:hypothetical protein
VPCGDTCRSVKVRVDADNDVIRRPQVHVSRVLTQTRGRDDERVPETDRSKGKRAQIERAGIQLIKLTKSPAFDQNPAWGFLRPTAQARR